MKNREHIIQQYFNCWINNDSSPLRDIFNEMITYIECWGPAYYNLNSILKWFNDWHMNGFVLSWDIKGFIHHDNIVVCEWFFKCNYSGKIDEFNGVSIIEFDCNNKIILLKEFQSTVPNYSPYD